MLFYINTPIQRWHTILSEVGIWQHADHGHDGSVHRQEHH